MKDKNSPKKLSLNDLLDRGGQFFLRYAVIFFLILLIGVYGFVGYQIVIARTAQPSDSDIAAKLQASPAPRVDPNTISQLQSLQDNSVNVKSLFDAARSNPFQE